MYNPLININEILNNVNKLKLINLKKINYMSKSNTFEEELAQAMATSRTATYNNALFKPAEHGLQIIEVAGDGSCFQHATKVALELLGINTIEIPQQIRFAAVNYQKMFPQQFAGFRDDHENLDALYEDSEYVEHHEIIATASAFILRIVIINANTCVPTIINPFHLTKDNPPTIYLYYNGLHYDALKIVDQAKFQAYCNTHNINYTENLAVNNNHQEEASTIAQAAINIPTVNGEDTELQQVLALSIEEHNKTLQEEGDAELALFLQVATDLEEQHNERVQQAGDEEFAYTLQLTHLGACNE